MKPAETINEKTPKIKKIDMGHDASEEKNLTFATSANNTNAPQLKPVRTQANINETSNELKKRKLQSVVI